MGEQSESTYGRRDIIKKTAVAGAVAWTAPVIVSSRALAADPSPGACEYYAIVKIEGGGPTIGTLFCELNKGYVQANPTSQAVTSGSYTEGGGGCFTLAPGVTLVDVVGKKRADECNSWKARDLVVTQSSGRYCVDAGQSHIVVIVCRDEPFTGSVISQGIASRALPPLESTTQLDTFDDVQPQQVITEEPVETTTTTTTTTEPPPEQETTTTSTSPTTSTSTSSTSSTTSTSSTSSTTTTEPALDGELIADPES